MTASHDAPAGGANSQTKAAFAGQFEIMTRSISSFCIVFSLLCLAIAPHTAQAQSLVRDAEIELLLDDYSRPLFRAAGLDPQRVGINLINDRNLNAFVTNGQNIYVHTGLILDADEPNMVIGVLAHEIGHITGGHLARGSEAAATAQRPALIATILGMGSILAGAGDLGLALITGGQQLAMGSFLTYSRGPEAAADNTALQLLEATGQSAEGIIGMMDQLANQEILSEVYQDPYARSHPMSRDRVNTFRNGAKNSPHNDSPDPQERIRRHRMAQAKIYGFLDSPTTTLRRYRNDKSQPAKYARAIAYFRQGLRDKALSELRQLIADMPDNAWLHELEGQIYYETGLAAGGIKPYEKAVALRPNEPLLLIGLASCLLEKGAAGRASDMETNRQAIAHLRNALRLDPFNGSAYLQMSKGYGQLDETALAQWALAEYYAAAGNKEARRHATRAIKGLPKGSVEYIRAVDILSSIKR
ncbi:MAG: M48 family metalloprotease [Parvibaculales bacterium]